VDFHEERSEEEGSKAAVATRVRVIRGWKSTTVVITARQRQSQKNSRSQTAPTLVQSFEYDLTVWTPPAPASGLLDSSVHSW